MNAYLRNTIVALVSLLLCLLPIQHELAVGLPVALQKTALNDWYDWYESYQFGSTWNLSTAEIECQTFIADTIENYSIIAQVLPFNTYGRTTVFDIFDAASGFLQVPRTVFYSGHGKSEYVWNFIFWEQQWLIYEDSGNKIYDKEIYQCSSDQGVKCAFLWACTTGDTIGGTHWSGTPFGMPYAWLHNNSLSGDGYANPSSGDQVFLGFEQYAPQFHNEAGYTGKPFLDFVVGFYYAALCFGCSVRQALDYAATCLSHTCASFADTTLYKGIYEQVINPPDPPYYVFRGRLKVYGNTNIHLSGESVRALKPKKNGTFYLPNTINLYMRIGEVFGNASLSGDQTGGTCPFYPDCSYPDGIVDMKDMGFVGSKFLKLEGDSGWDYMADVFPDRRIDMRDIAEVANNIGKVGSYDNLTWVTVLFKLQNGSTVECAPDQSTGLLVIPADAASFTLIRNGTQIGGVAMFLDIVYGAG